MRKYLTQREKELIVLERIKVIEEIKEKIPTKGTKHSGYWIYEGKRVTYDPVVFTSELLNWLDDLLSI